MSETLHQPDFDEQFSQERPIEGRDGSFIYIHPETATDQIPVLFAPGFAEDDSSLRHAARQAFDLNRSVIVVNHPRHNVSGIAEGAEINEETYKAETLLAVLETAQVDQCDVIAHSEGALNACLAGLMEPQRFRSIILAMPAGLIGEDSLLGLAGRFSRAAVRGISKDILDNPRMAIAQNTNVVKHISTNIKQAFREAQGLASISIDETLDGLWAQGIKVGVLQSHWDPVFPAKRIQQHVKPGFRSDRPDTPSVVGIDSYASVNSRWAGHQDFIVNPQRAVSAALQMLDDLNGKPFVWREHQAI